MFIEEKLNLQLDFNKEKIKKFLSENDLLLENCESCYCVFENEKIIACGCREKNVLKCFAVDENYRGENLFDKIISSLLTECYNENLKTIFVFTKLKNIKFFESYNFVVLASGMTSTLMYKSDESIIQVLEKTMGEHTVQKNFLTDKKIGAVVINANPFTLGHKFLITAAAKEVDLLFVFVVEENKSFFSFAERFFLVQKNSSELLNVHILPSTKFLISAATFPSYFLKEKKLISSEHALIDARIFGKYFVPQFHIATRFLGDEPIDESTRFYNKILSEELPKYHCSVKIFSRLKNSEIVISASLVRKYFLEKNFEKIKPLVSNITIDFLKQKAHEI